MRAALFSEHGDPDVLEIGEIETPEPGPAEVRIRVRACALNHLDLWVRRGLPIEITMPHIGGSDIAGEVDALGPGAGDIPEGTRVVVDPALGWEWMDGIDRGPDLPGPRFEILGEHTQGGFAEYVVVPAANLFQLPDHVSFEIAAAAGLVYATAWRALLARGGLRAGETVLITGGSGGVATAAIQIARSAGARVLVLTSGGENVRRVRELGADRGIDRMAGPVGDVMDSEVGRGTVDLVLDSVGEPVWESLVRALRVGGRIVIVGSTGGPRVTTDLRRVFWKQLSILGSTMASPAEYRQVMRQVFDGVLEPVIDDVLPLDRIRDAHARLEAGRVFGKLVIRPDA